MTIIRLQSGLIPTISGDGDDNGGGGNEGSMDSLPGYIASWEADSQQMSVNSDLDQPLQWLDSGESWDLERGGTPTYIENAVNGLPALRFARSSPTSGQRFYRTTTSGVPNYNTVGQTIYAVVKLTDMGDTSTLRRHTIISHYHSSFTAAQAFWLHVASTVDGIRVVYRLRASGVTFSQSDVGVFPFNQWVVVAARFISEISLDIWLNGNNVASSAISSGVTGPISNADTNTDFNIGMLRYTDDPWDGDIANVYLYNQAHENSAVEDVSADLASKYGISA